jgi:predicted Zn-dependent protease
LTLTSLMLNNDLYARAGKILQKGLDDGTITSNLKHWRLLAQAWTMAQENEKAIDPLTRAAELSPDGKLHIILAQTHMNIGQWEDAVAAVQDGLRKGGLDRPGGAQIMLGQAYFELEKFNEARAAFQAVTDDRSNRQIAAQWLNYIDSEEDRKAQLAAALE